VTAAADWASRGRRWLRRRFVEPSPPLAVIEVRPKAVGAVRVSSQGGRLSLVAAACVDLPAGVLEVSMTEANVRSAAAFQTALRSVAEKAGVLGAGAVALVLPDPVARVALLPASELKARRRADADEMLRFRLRKTVPFEIREARLSTAPAGSQGGEPQVLVGAILRSILEEFEAPCRALGLDPGMVLLAGPTLLEEVEARFPAEDRLLVNWDEGYLSLLLSRGGSPVLIRTLLGAAVATPESAGREVAQTATYYRERLGGAGLARVVLRAAGRPVDEAVAVVETALGRTPEILDPWGPLNPGDALSAQALAGAAAFLARRAA
jgi:hypothetical protein